MASNSVGSVGMEITADTNSFSTSVESAAQHAGDEITRILENTEGSLKSKAARIAGVYRKQGQGISEAMKNAHEVIRQSTQQTVADTETSTDGLRSKLSKIANNVKAKFINSNRNIKENTKKSTENMSDSFSKLGAGIKTVFSVVAITAFTKKIISVAQECTKAAEIQTNAEVKLSTIMKQRMKATSDSIKSVEAFASAQQELGVVGDEIQLAGTQQLATFLETDTALKSLIPAMNNLAVQQNGVNVTSESMVNIGNLMGKVMQGQTAALTRVGITFSDAEEQVLKYGNEQERASMLAQVITNNVGEMNKAIASTPAGQMQQVKNNLGDIQETLGRAVNNIFAPLIKYLNIAVSKLAELANGFEEVTKKLFGDSNNKDVSTGGVGMVAESADTATESLEGTEEQAKKLEKRLSGFDELNVLDSDEDESDNTESTATSPVDTDSINSANNQLSVMDKAIDNIKGKLKSLSSTLGFDRLISNIQRGINSVNWGSIGSNFKSIMTSLQPIAQASFNGVKKIAMSSMDTLGKYIGGVISVSGKQLQTVTGGVAKWLDKNKDKISAGITEISNNISSGIDNIGSFYDSIFSTLGNSIDRMRPTVENALSTMLTGFSDFGLSLGTILSSEFNIATENLSEWAVNNSATIGTFFDNIQLTFSEVATLIGNVFSEISQILNNWWSGGAAVVFDQVCRAITDIGTTLMNVYNEWIQPVIDTAIGILSDFWEYTIKPIFENIMDLVKKVADYFSTLWNNILSPIVNWLVKTLAPVIKNVLNVIKGIFQTVFKVIGDVISGFLKAIGGVIDFLTNVFKGNWKKAFESIFDILDGILQSILGVIKGAFNIVIDALNGLIAGVYSVFSTIANIIGEAAGIIGNLFGQDWSFKMPAEAPIIPKLAKGGIVKAPTLALVGDNAGANTGNPEVVAPLNKLQSMLNTGDGSAEDNAILSQILQYMVKIYELMLNSGSDIYEFVAQLDGDVIFKKMIQANNRYKKRHGGKSAFV